MTVAAILQAERVAKFDPAAKFMLEPRLERRRPVVFQIVSAERFRAPRLRHTAGVEA